MWSKFLCIRARVVDRVGAPYLLYIWSIFSQIQFLVHYNRENREQNCKKRGFRGFRGGP